MDRSPRARLYTTLEELRIDVVQCVLRSSNLRLSWRGIYLLRQNWSLADFEPDTIDLLLIRPRGIHQKLAWHWEYSKYRLGMVTGKSLLFFLLKIMMIGLAAGIFVALLPMILAN